MAQYNVYSKPKGGGAELWDTIEARNAQDAIRKAKQSIKSMKARSRSSSMHKALTRTNWRAERVQSKKGIKKRTKAKNRRKQTFKYLVSAKFNGDNRRSAYKHVQATGPKEAVKKAKKHWRDSIKNAKNARVTRARDWKAVRAN